MPLQSSGGSYFREKISKHNKQGFSLRKHLDTTGHCWLTAILLLTWIGKSVCSVTQFMQGLKAEFPGFCPWVASQCSATAKPREGFASLSLARRGELCGQQAAASPGHASHFPSRQRPLPPEETRFLSAFNEWLGSLFPKTAAPKLSTALRCKVQ